MKVVAIEFSGYHIPLKAPTPQFVLMNRLHEAFANGSTEELLTLFHATDWKEAKYLVNNARRAEKFYTLIESGDRVTIAGRTEYKFECIYEESSSPPESRVSPQRADESEGIQSEQKPAEHVNDHLARTLLLQEQLTDGRDGAAKE